ncbi:hypothetical protein AB6A40_009494 [Gnathostoma spinigerum]|uniref:PRA1 family protein n=1 Tax=Gnathostoma spinigerum TaxID=75299 RepID=A0ABD6F1P2_9BILA
MSSSDAAETVEQYFLKLTDDLQFPPFRKLSEFLARDSFQAPPFRDFPRWNKRLEANLLYFQSNYFAIIIILSLVLSTFQAVYVAYGLCAIALSTAVILFSVAGAELFVKARQEHPLITLGGIVLSSYFFIYNITSVITALFVVALPLLLCLVHASIRGKSMKIRANRELEKLGAKKTAMGKILNLLEFRY